MLKRAIYCIFLKTIGLVAMLCLFSNKQAKASDPQFTQFYAAPLYLNPAFAGAIDCWRAGVNYRNQWFLGNQPYTTYKAFVDHNLAATTRFRGGAGMYVFRDNPGAGNYTTYEIAPMVSYYLPLSQKHSLRFGLQPSYHLKYANFGNFVYGDQIDNVTGNIGATSDGQQLAGSRNIFDLSTGVLLYNKNYWVGFAAHHLLNNPLLVDPKTSVLPMKLSLHAGYKFYLGDDETSITPAVNVRSQWANLQADMGLYYEKRALILGAWYRGLPFLGGAGLNTDMVAALVGLRVNPFKIGYSYDLSLSKMSYTWGTHELSIIYEFCFYYRKRPRPPMNVRMLPCP